MRRRSLSDSVLLDVVECAGLLGAAEGAGVEAMVGMGDVFDSGNIGLCNGREAEGLLSDGFVIWLGHCGTETRGCKGCGLENEGCTGRSYIESMCGWVGAAKLKPPYSFEGDWCCE